MTRLAAVILAGGAARRFGGLDKPLLEVGGRRILTRTLELLRGETALVALNAAGDPARFDMPDLPVIGDGEFAGQGPLAGILAGLEWAAGKGAEFLLSVPGDMPFLPPGLAASLHPAPACAEAGGHKFPVVALWPTGCRQVLAARLRGDVERSVAGFADVIGMRAVHFANGDCFANINTPEELAAARARAG